MINTASRKELEKIMLQNKKPTSPGADSDRETKIGALQKGRVRPLRKKMARKNR